MLEDVCLIEINKGCFICAFLNFACTCYIFEEVLMDFGGYCWSFTSLHKGTLNHPNKLQYTPSTKTFTHGNFWMKCLELWAQVHIAWYNEFTSLPKLFDEGVPSQSGHNLSCTPLMTLMTMIAFIQLFKFFSCHSNAYITHKSIVKWKISLVQ